MNEPILLKNTNKMKTQQSVEDVELLGNFEQFFNG